MNPNIGNEISIASLFSMAPEILGIIVGAFAGSIIFVLSEIEHSNSAKFALFVATMIIGISSADFTAAFASHLLFKLMDCNITISKSVGAAISSSISVRLLIHISNNLKNKMIFPT